MKNIILGTVQLGMKYGITNASQLPSLEESFDIMGYALAHGFEGLDTAQAYGDSEAIIGNFLIQHKKNFVLQTKLYPLSKLANISIEESILDSFEKLNTDYIDIFMFHRLEDSKNQEAMGFLLKLKEEKKIGEIGCSLSDPEELIECLKNKSIKFIQLPFNLLDYRWLTSSIQSALRERSDVKIQVRSIFLQGLLLLSDASKFPKFSGLDADAIVKTIKNLTQEFELKDAMTLCYSYALSQHWINSIVIGVSNKKELIENLQAQKTRILSYEELEMVRSKLIDVPEVFLNPANWNKA